MTDFHNAWDLELKEKDGRHFQLGLLCPLLMTAALGAFIFIYVLFTTYCTESSKVVSALELSSSIKINVKKKKKRRKKLQSFQKKECYCAKLYSVHDTYKTLFKRRF